MLFEVFPILLLFVAREELGDDARELMVPAHPCRAEGKEDEGVALGERAEVHGMCLCV